MDNIYNRLNRKRKNMHICSTVDLEELLLCCHLLVCLSLLHVASLRLGGESRSSGDHVVLIGDAAGMIDPMTGDYQLVHCNLHHNGAYAVVTCVK